MADALVCYERAGFTNAEKYDKMTSGFDIVSYNAPGKYSHILSVGPYALAPGESEVVAFSFVAGDDLGDLISNAYMSFVMYPNITGVETAETLPESHSLLSNYPNPFNGSTVIKGSGIDGDGSVEIYDIAGRLVKRIPFAGRQEVIRDGTNEPGNEVSAGIYFARLSGESKAVRKMLFLK